MIVKAAAGGILALTLTTVLIAAGTSAVLSQLLGGSGGSHPSATALSDIPPGYLLLYQQAAPNLPRAGLDHSRRYRQGRNRPRPLNPARRAYWSQQRRRRRADAVPAGHLRRIQPACTHRRSEPTHPYDPIDAIYAAARMLCANGARDGADLHGAIYAYNHTETYVVDVLNHAHTYAATTTPTGDTPLAGSAWTPAIGQAIANRGLAWLGWPYSYAAGNTQRPHPRPSRRLRLPKRQPHHRLRLLRTRPLRPRTLGNPHPPRLYPIQPSWTISTPTSATCNLATSSSGPTTEPSTASATTPSTSATATSSKPPTAAPTSKSRHWTP